MVTLVLGEARSGRSRYAQQIAETTTNVLFGATAEARDDRRTTLRRRRTCRETSLYSNRMKRTLALLIVAATTLPCSASRTVTDEFGHLVTVPDHPHRIIASSPASRMMSSPSASETTSSQSPTTCASQQKPTIKSLSTALNREQQATALTTNLQHRIDAVRASVRGKPIVRLFMPQWYDPVITISKAAFITEIIEAAGGHSITSYILQEWPLISMETVIACAPESLLLVRRGKTNFDVLKDKPGWDTLPAVKLCRAYYIDRRADFPSPVAIEALEDLAKQFHP